MLGAEKDNAVAVCAEVLMERSHHPPAACRRRPTVNGLVLPRFLWSPFCYGMVLREAFGRPRARRCGERVQT